MQTYYKKQPAAHVYNMNAKMFLAPEDHFIASGPLSMIPGNSPRIGLKLFPTPCHLCGHVYGRIIMSNHCRHGVCSYCLGATCLISVDHYICECWRDIKIYIAMYFYHPRSRVLAGTRLCLHCQGRRAGIYPKLKYQTLPHVINFLRDRTLSLKRLSSTRDWPNTTSPGSASCGRSIPRTSPRRISTTTSRS